MKEREGKNVEGAAKGTKSAENASVEDRKRTGLNWRGATPVRNTPGAQEGSKN